MALCYVNKNEGIHQTTITERTLFSDNVRLPVSCCVTPQTYLLRHTADMSAESHSRHACCSTLQTCLPCDTADLFVCHTADVSILPRSRHVC